MKRAIYLSGGGARGAYQAGVLKGIQEILSVKELPAQILSSVSVGAINAAILAMHAKNFTIAVNRLEDLWLSIRSDKIFRVGNFSLIKILIRNIASMLFHYQPKDGGHLFDTSPLKNLLGEVLNFDLINQNIANGLVEFEVTATCYDTSEAVSFINSSENVCQWNHARHQTCVNNIECQHILASSAFPLFFPAIKVDQFHYGDGGIRLSTPLRAAVELGATDILIIGTRASPLARPIHKTPATEGISFASILGNMLNALFLDNLDRDLQQIDKINDYLRLLPQDKLDKSHWHHINILCIRPSIDIGHLAIDKQKVLPSLLRYVMGSFGSKLQSGDLLSFLLFESDFCKDLVELGYKDTLDQEKAVINFFNHRSSMPRLIP